MPLLIALLVAATALPIPLGEAGAWEVLRYDRIRPHAVHFDAAGLRIEVDGSAAPVIHALAAPRRVQRLEASGRIDGTMRTTASRQGQDGHDDYTLRIGLVEVGSRRPGWFERQFAPAWVKRLFALAPPELGIAGIRFYNLGLASSQIGAARQHPDSDLIRERVVAVPDEDGRFTIAVDLESPVEAAAIWISSDGDDTGSRFTMVLERLVLTADLDASEAVATRGSRSTARRGRQ